MCAKKVCGRGKPSEMSQECILQEFLWERRVAWNWVIFLPYKLSQMPILGFRHMCLVHVWLGKATVAAVLAHKSGQNIIVFIQARNMNGQPAQKMQTNKHCWRELWNAVILLWSVADVCAFLYRKISAQTIKWKQTICKRSRADIVEPNMCDYRTVKCDIHQNTRYADKYPSVCALWHLSYCWWCCCCCFCLVDVAVVAPTKTINMITYFRLWLTGSFLLSFYVMLVRP